MKLTKRILIIASLLVITSTSAFAAEPHRVDMPFEADGYTFVATCLSEKEKPEIGDCLCYYVVSGELFLGSEYDLCPISDPVTLEKNRTALENRAREIIRVEEERPRKEEEKRSRLRNALLKGSR